MATPHPTPTPLLELEKGTLYGEQRDRAKNEPKALTERTPICPARFSKEEKREWRYYKKILQTYGLWTMAAAPVLEMLCTAVAHYKKAAATVAETGLIVKGPLGQPKKNPYWLVMNEQEKIILKYHQELGLSTTGLARMGALIANARKENDTWGDLLD